MPRHHRQPSLGDDSTAAFPTKPRAMGDGMSYAEPDTCRICRGEATPEEPLFYPCKCSGSIKYVHQDCLMEWLSHSQKKHCELCKTSFRFTKLYSPTMPKQLPLFIFIRHLAKYFLRNVLVWLRIGLVASVWLGWLPYLTRWEWSFLFWISEEGLVSPHAMFVGDDSLLHNASTLATSAAAAAVATASSAVCLSSPLLESATTAAAAAISTAAQGPLDIAVATASSSVAVSQYGESNMTAGATLLSGFFGFLVGLISPGDFVPAAASNISRTAAAAAAAAAAGTLPPTLLSEVGFLRSLTRYNSVNCAIIYALEGQIITILVIVCCVLVILVRDYVVQQQPEINMRAAFAAAAGEDAEEDQQPRMVQRIGDIMDIHDNGRHDDDDDDNNNNDATDWEVDSDSDLGDALHPNRNREGLELQSQDMPPAASRAAEDSSLAVPAVEPLRTLIPHDSSSGMPALEQVDRQRISGAEAQSMSNNTVEGASAQDDLRVYREAGGDFDEMLRIARAEHMEGGLEYWLRLNQHMAERKKQTEQGGSERGISGDGSASALASAVLHNGGDAADAVWSENWPWGDESGASGSGSGNGLASNDKGKERAAEDDAAAATATADMNTFGSGGGGSGGLRPRAHTDGPQRIRGINPLAYNSWTFPDSPRGQQGDADGSGGPGEGTVSQTNTPTSGTLPSAASSTESRRPDTPAPESGDMHEDSEGAWEDASDEEDTNPTPSSMEVDTDRPQAGDEARNVSNTTHDGHEQEGVDGHTNATLAVGAGAGAGPAAGGGAAAAAAAAAAAPAVGARAGAAAARPANWLNRAADFMWRDLDNIDPLELVAAGPDAGFEMDEGQFEALEAVDLIGPAEADGEALEAAAAAAAAGLDAEAIEDAEDLEGLMEILGMRGPVTALFQNAIFCAFLVTLTLVVGVFVPYNIGRLAAWLLAHPMRPVMVLFGVARLLQDVAAVVLGGCLFAVFHTLHVAVSAWAWVAGGRGPATATGRLASTLFAAWNMCAGAALRVANSFTLEPPILSAGEMRNFSAVSHEALLSLKGQALAALTGAGQAVAFVGGGDYGQKGAAALRLATTAAGTAGGLLRAGWGVLVRPGTWVITLDSGRVAGPPVDAALAFWDSTDRFLATGLGYSTLCLLAGLYLYRGTPFSSGATGQAWEASVIDGLNQASGVLKVILIIGIEMLAFPLYCGLLLDVALLPLFEEATLTSRLHFALSYPLTSVFVHWFVGTGYMFHFALFVSMCRKIMRRGVLYFIRDPDDPEFHPVRDVLERNMVTQLRKILFSAFVYGALVVVCLGGVVWGLALAAPGVLPIHYSSNEPVLEFPIDLMFYNSLMPLAIRFFRPSDGLHAMYTWWFRKSARILRITWFLFGERRLDEEGDLALADGSPHRQAPWWRRLLLEYAEDRDEVVPKTWADTLAGGTARPRSEIPDKEMRDMAQRKQRLVASGQLVPSGRFVRAPASDQVKIPKGRAVFLEVTESNQAVVTRMADTATAKERTLSDVYSVPNYRFVYIPPHFRVRVLLFIAFIWLFAAATGVAITVVPLLFGRRAFQLLLPAHVRTNDIYAFSIGTYVLGAASYALWHARALLTRAAAAARRGLAALTAVNAVRKTAAATFWVARLVYAYFFLVVVFPLLAAALVELYVLIPLHTYMYGGVAGVSSVAGMSGVAGMPEMSEMSEMAGMAGMAGMTGMTGAAPPLASHHTVRLVQSWTLGVLYLKLAARTVTSWHDGSRLSAAVRAVLRRGQLDPDVRILTRAFVVPGLLLGTAAVAVPLLLARWVETSGLGSALIAATASTASRSLVYRMSFPAVALAAAAAWSLWGMVDVFGTWRVRIRDEAYLIGERLHNFSATAGQHARRGRRGRI